VNHLVGGLKTVPIDPRNAHHLAIRIQNLATTGMPVTSPLRENRRGENTQPDDYDRDKGKRNNVTVQNSSSSIARREDRLHGSSNFLR